MSIQDDPEFDEVPPPWFSNDEPAPEDEEPRSRRRWILAAGVVIIVVVLLLIPVLQAEILQRRRDSLPDEAMDRVALLFASAMLLGRQEGQAMIFTHDEAQDDVRATLDQLVDMPFASRQARLQVITAPCSLAPADACYQGRVLDPATLTAPAIRFGVDDTDVGPKIIWVEIDALRVQIWRRWPANADVRRVALSDVGCTIRDDRCGRIRPSTSALENGRVITGVGVVNWKMV